ncbi:MAG: hypothetical protein KJO91_04205 [Gammaproteobacteria bacterium]|nr:hypothetical protein [Gammaproteobacteria bacterium]
MTDIDELILRIKDELNTIDHAKVATHAHDLLDESATALQEMQAEIARLKQGWIADSRQDKQRIAEQEADYDLLNMNYRSLVAQLDDQNGTPCEQIRHEQEVETLQARISELEKESDELSDKCTEFEQRIEDLEPYYTAVDESCVAAHIGTAESFESPKHAVNALGAWSESVGAYFAKEENKRLDAALAEAIDLMEDTITGDYKPDSFTTQPWKKARAGE